MPLDKLVGNIALITVEQKTSGKGRKYSRILSAVGVPKQMAAHLPAFSDYTRAEYWQEKKDAYRKDALQFRAEIGVTEDGEPIPSGGDEGTDADSDFLPF